MCNLLYRADLIFTEAMPLPNYSLCMNVSETTGEDEFVVNYFKQGYTNLEILEFLKLHNSVSTLKRRLQAHGLRRRSQGGVVSNRELFGVIVRELAGSGCNIGYRKMWQRLRKNHDLVMKRSRVMECL